MSRWESAWTEILEGVSQRWKAGEKAENYLVLERYLEATKLLTGSESLFFPLVGDHPFAAIVYKKGYSFCATELVRKAAAALREKCETEWNEEIVTTENGTQVELWTTKDGRGKIWIGDHFTVVKELETGQYPVIIDKDAFGALPAETREEYIAGHKKLLIPGGHVVLEGQQKQSDLDQGPPYHLTQELIENTWKDFEILDVKTEFYKMDGSLTPIAFLLKDKRQ